MSHDSPKPSQRIVGESRLQFTDNEQLRSYYEEKYRTGGYEEGGHVVHGVDVSEMYHTRRKAVALRYLAPRAEDVVLDAGCGSGKLTAQIAPYCRTIHAVDIAVNALNEQFLGIPNLQFQAMNLEALHYPDEHFDAVVCVETIEHVLNPVRAIAELTRVLKREGRLVLTYPTINRTIAKRLRLTSKITVSEHLNEWSYDEIRRIAAAAGLRCSKAEGIAFDLGPFLALKQLNRFFAVSITKVGLAIRHAPSNSMFVAFEFQKG